MKPLSEIDEYIVKNDPKIAGTIIYITITARPDLSYAAVKLSRGMHAPTKLHSNMLKDVVGYMRQNMATKLKYTQASSMASLLFSELSSGDNSLTEMHSHNHDDNKPRYRPDKKHPDPIFGMSDSSYAPSNEKNRRSVSGRCYFLFGSLISWCSKLQPVTAASTHEAELIAVASAADEGVWIRNLLLETGFILTSISGFYQMPTSKDMPTDFRSYAPLLSPTPLYGDNQSTILSSNNPETASRSRHLEVRFFKVRDYVLDGCLRVK